MTFRKPARKHAMPAGRAGLFNDSNPVVLVLTIVIGTSTSNAG
ncbi:MAG: hypothetical protein RIC38_06995 [Chromatocurvus sp.]